MQSSLLIQSVADIVVIVSYIRQELREVSEIQIFPHSVCYANPIFPTSVFSLLTYSDSI